MAIRVKGSSITAVPVENTRTSPPRPEAWASLEIWALLRIVSCGAVTTTSPPRPRIEMDEISAPDLQSQGAGRHGDLGPVALISVYSGARSAPQGSIVPVTVTEMFPLRAVPSA